MFLSDIEGSTPTVRELKPWGEASSMLFLTPKLFAKAFNDEDPFTFDVLVETKFCGRLPCKGDLIGTL